MPTWDEIREHLRATYKLMKDEPSWIGLGFTFPDGGNTRQQRVRVATNPPNTFPGVVIWADVVEATRVPHQKALERNMAFSIGALAIHDGMYVLRAVLPYDGLAWTTFDSVLEFIAREAMRLRKDAPPGS